MENRKLKTPVYYISHGGPEFMYMKDFEAYKVVETMGKEIVNCVKPKGVIAISAHWEVDANTIYVNTELNTDLIYDFANRPNYMYEEKYPNVGSEELSSKIIELLNKHNIKSVGTNRGLDHGVWCSFKIAFPPERPLNVPIVQISLFKNNDPNLHIDVGRALASLREEGIVIITSGMSVHNLNERYDYPNGKIANYTIPFDNALVEAVTKNVGEHRRAALIDLLKRDDCKLAHPTLEHLFPIYVAAGAAFDESAELLYTSYQGSFAWGQYRFGSQPQPNL